MMAHTAPCLRVLLIDDHALFRESVARALGAEPGFEVSHCASVAEALRLLETSPVDVVLLDYDLGVERGDRFLGPAKQMGFAGRVLVLTAWVSDQEARRLIRQGAAGILLKESPLEVLGEAIRTVAGGGAWLDQRFLRALAGVEAPESAQPRAPLSDRERKLLRCLLEGLTNKEIAERLPISETAVKAALQQLFQKTGVRSRSQLVRVALEQYHDQI
jgi:two-component system nitrate/nitrite response regulator NarL